MFSVVLRWTPWYENIYLNLLKRIQVQTLIVLIYNETRMIILRNFTEHLVQFNEFQNLSDRFCSSLSEFFFPSSAKLSGVIYAFDWMYHYETKLLGLESGELSAQIASWPLSLFVVFNFLMYYSLLDNIRRDQSCWTILCPRNSEKRDMHTKFMNFGITY